MNPMPVPPVSAIIVMVMAALVAFDMTRRAQHLGNTAGQLWRLAAAIALGSGIWCQLVQGIAQAVPGPGVGFHPVLTLAAWVFSVAVCLAALGWAATAASRRWQVASAAAALALCTLVTQMMLLSALSLRSTIDPHGAPLALAGLAGYSAFVLALALALRLPACTSRMTPSVGQFAAAGMACMAVWLCQALSLDTAAMKASMVPEGDTMIGASTLALLAPVASAEFLLMMLLACAVERRFTGSLEAARLGAPSQPLRDELTGLPNRAAFEALLARELIVADANKRDAVVMLVALDGFKRINDQFGHQQGDLVLRHAAQALRAQGPAGRAARLGGDEFLLLVTGDDAMRQAAVLAAQVLDAVSQPWEENGRDMTLSCSIGMAVYPRHGAQSALMAHVSVAMRSAKGIGGATYAFFDPRMVSAAHDQTEMLFDLRQALSRGQLELYYQPKIHAPSAQITGVEALLRWHHPKRGSISPDIFIPMAERSGLIDSLGEWVIDEACRQARLWRDQGLRMRVAVNVSAHQLRQANLPDRIADALQRHHINPDLLTCEITESVAMEDTEITLRFFTAVAALGVHLSIDDFGSGYSSLAYLRKLRATELKIDRSFVLDLETSAEARKIAQAVVQLAQALNMTVVAEGVESEGQYAILREFGCDQLQGFLFARPMSAKALTLWALADGGPQSAQFRESLFQETRAIAL